MLLSTCASGSKSAWHVAVGCWTGGSSGRLRKAGSRGVGVGSRLSSTSGQRTVGALAIRGKGLRPCWASPKLKRHTRPVLGPVDLGYEKEEAEGNRGC